MRTRSKADTTREQAPGDKAKVEGRKAYQGGKNKNLKKKEGDKPKDAVANSPVEDCTPPTTKLHQNSGLGDGEHMNLFSKKKRKTVKNVEDSVDVRCVGSCEIDFKRWAKMDKEMIKINEDEIRVRASGCNTPVESKSDAVKGENVTHGHENLKEDRLTGAFHRGSIDVDGLDWEEGSISLSTSRPTEGIEGMEKYVTVEFSMPSSSKKRACRRASAKDKELAELVHKVHLLCLLARGRLVDAVCDDPLIQASLLSLLSPHLLKFSEKKKLSANHLVPLMEWLRNNFHVCNESCNQVPFKLSLSSAIENHEGTSEEVAALSVALFRALGLTARFVSVLDASPLRPDTESSVDREGETFGLDTDRSPNSSRKAVTNLGKLFTGLPPCATTGAKNLRGNNISQSFQNEENPRCNKDRACNSLYPETPLTAGRLCSEFRDQIVEAHSFETNKSGPSETDARASGSKRKGDLEFEIQMQMAVSATAAVVHEGEPQPCLSDLAQDPILDKTTKPKGVLITGKESSSAFWTRKRGAPMHWAEVYCDGELLTGKWVQVDAVNAIVDGESKVEAAVAACRKTLRYVVAFAGCGAKDVTRRYCMKWYSIASKRVDTFWWNAVMTPLRGLESAATDRIAKSEMLKHDIPSRSTLEDMELDTRALTEPLPTNQQAYRTHHLYAIERWLTKYQVLHPKGPLLGYCSGHPVYPRTCVQTLHTRHRWLREGLQVKENELPAKVVRQARKIKRVQTWEYGDEFKDDDGEGVVELYGKWQTEELCLPHAVDGIVPKNDRGQVELWSEKCLPPGTVHLKLPRLETVARRLGVDFAPAMVGFEFRNGSSVPVFDGIVVCQEYRDAILEAYAEEEERREVQEKIRNEALAIARWTQLLSSMITRQRLRDTYDPPSWHPNQVPLESSYGSHGLDHANMKSGADTSECMQEDKSAALSVTTNNGHEHVFPTEYQSFDEESSMQTKRCPCGFSIQVEKM